MAYGWRINNAAGAAKIQSADTLYNRRLWRHFRVTDSMRTGRDVNNQYTLENFTFTGWNEDNTRYLLPKRYYYNSAEPFDWIECGATFTTYTNLRFYVQFGGAYSAIPTSSTEVAGICNVDGNLSHADGEVPFVVVVDWYANDIAPSAYIDTGIPFY